MKVGPTIICHFCRQEFPAPDWALRELETKASVEIECSVCHRKMILARVVRH